MADFTTPIPIEPEKVAFLHDRSNRPAAPSGRRNIGGYLLLVVIGIGFSAALLALAFQARASWTEARDWVVPVTVPFYAIGGVALAYLVMRRAWLAASAGLVLGGLALAFTAFNLWRAALTSGEDALRDWLSILTGIAVGLAIAAVSAGMVWIEVRRSSSPPPPEV